ncbi:MAG TPA: hypothetical protein GX499_02620 [Clostridiales bacterium]|nr:hypothetical protein [Clostridiales bacterium]
MYIPMVDALAFGLDIEAYEDSAALVLQQLEQCKETAKSRMKDKSPEKVTYQLGDMAFEVLPNGANGYAYILHNHLFQIKIAQFRSTNPNFFPVKVIIKAEALWSLSPEDAFATAYQLVNEQIGTVIANKISRMDLCCHMDTIAFDKVHLDHFKGNFRSTNTRAFNRVVSGIEFGTRSSKVFSRIYDKTLEVKQKGQKLWFLDIWQNHGWDGKQTIWNVEFELKREFFSHFRLDSVEDAFGSLSSIWHYLMDEWLVLTLNDRTRIENATICKEWLTASKQFDHYVSCPLIAPEKQMARDAEVLIPALNGYAKKISAFRNVPHLKEAFHGLEEDIKRYNRRKGTTFEAEVEKVRSLICGKEGSSQRV